MSTLSAKLSARNEHIAATKQARTAREARKLARHVASLPYDTRHGIRTLGAHSTSAMQAPVTYREARKANPPRSDMGTYIPRQQAFDRTFYVEYLNMSAQTLAISTECRQPWSCASWAEGFPTVANVRRWLRRNATVQANGETLHRMEARIYRVDTGEHVLTVTADAH